MMDEVVSGGVLDVQIAVDFVDWSRPRIEVNPACSFKIHFTKHLWDRSESHALFRIIACHVSPTKPRIAPPATEEIVVFLSSTS
jgi:hypothetical protein